MTIEEAWDISQNFSSHTDQEVIEAIDVLCSTPIANNEIVRLNNILQTLKWSNHYSHAIDDPDKALNENPSFLADVIMWQGYEKTLRMRRNSQESAGPE